MSPAFVDSCRRSRGGHESYGAGSTTVLVAVVTAVCASSLPVIDAPAPNVMDV